MVYNIDIGGYKVFWELGNHYNDCPIFIKSIFT